jgi:hypothetical protein
MTESAILGVLILGFFLVIDQLKLIRAAIERQPDKTP